MKVVIVGGGPTGLHLACSIKRRIPNYDVTVLEKRSQYSRKQVLLIQKDVLDVLPQKVKEDMKNLGCYVYPPGQDTLGRCYNTPVVGGLASIQTRSLEDILKRCALEQGVKIRETNVTLDTPELAQADVIVGADGASSFIAEHVLEAKSLSHQTLETQYGMTFIYKPSKNIKYEGSRDRLISPMQYRRRVFRTPDNEYYIGLTISEQTYNTLNLIKQKRGKLTVDNLPQNVTDAILTAIYSYHKMTPDVADLNKVEMNLILIPFTYRDPVADMVRDNSGKEKLVVLAGDSAFTAHFFSGQGVNSGLRSAEKLAALLEEESGILGNYKTLVKKYNRFVKKERQARWSKYPVLFLPFEEVDEICNEMSRNQVNKFAQELGYVTRNMTKREACLTIGKSLLPKKKATSSRKKKRSRRRK